MTNDTYVAEIVLIKGIVMNELDDLGNMLLTV